MKAHYNYITTDLTNGMRYIGSHFGKLGDSYLGSGKRILRAINKHGKENFVKEELILCHSFEEAFKNEAWLIRLYDTLHPIGYNLSPTGGMGVRGCYHHPETIKKMAEHHKGKKHLMRKHSSTSFKKGHVPWLKGKKMPEEIRMKLAKCRVGISPTPESIQKGLETRRSKFEGGKIKIPEEMKQRISNTLKGHPVSEETRRKISETKKLNWMRRKGLLVET